ncbi:hypothetical protein PTKIN_Ptkin05aG0181800 [Pterospermum kingtungense]
MEFSGSSQRSHAHGDLESLEEKNTHQINLQKCRETILTLPCRTDWQFPSPLYKYQGIWNTSFLLEGLMLAQKQFNPQPTDIILCSHPKTGTTWLKALAFAVVTRSSDDSTSPLLTRTPHDCVTFMEMDAAQGINNRDPGIPLVATHSPYISLPNSIITSGCKIVYICRDPKDAFLSLWHFMRNQPWVPQVTFERAFDLFCEGVSGCGPYWEHVLGYWKASLESPERILFLKYEDLKNNTSFGVKRLAEFTGYRFSLEKEKRGVVEKIIGLCSLENLKSLEVNKSGQHRPNSIFACENESFFRKGKVGDWKSDMTPKMGARLDRIMEQKLSGSGLSFSSN